ncbi:MAG: SPFH domain-containing protein [Planctomycetota bacterium]|jgi:regulator of protease activity HflC (stomatin/prohibitin superfamily)
MATSSKRAEHIALTSLIISVIFSGVTFFVGRATGFFAVSALSWLILAAALVWFVLLIQFHQRSLAEQEKLDMSQLATGKKDAAIFQAKGEQAALFAVSQRRLNLLEKWFIPIFSVLIALYKIAIGLYLFNAASIPPDFESERPLLVAIGMTAIAFVSFLLSRYATGMSAQPQWKPLRAGGSYLLGAAVLSFVLALGLALVQFEISIVINIINWVVPALLVVLGAETALNVVLDIYRPRLKDQYSRAAFDSRLLGAINEPGGILRSAADAIDYQFGFQVSQTWFYQLLVKAIAPLILFFVLAPLYLLSCIIVVAPNEEVIIEHFGNPLKESGEVRAIGPGIAFKWPWPIDIAYSYPTKRISEISIGFIPKDDLEHPEPLLWGKEHYKKEYSLLVASEQTSGASAEGAVPVSLLIAAVPVQYRIKDLYSFLYKYGQRQERDGTIVYGAEDMLESICYRELTKFAASAKIEVDDEDQDRPGIRQSLLGAGRAGAKRILTHRIQQAADKAELGVEIMFLGLQGIHPPPEVASAYQKVVGAVQKKQALILGAQGHRNTTLTTLVGSVQDANDLYTLARKYQEAKRRNGSEQAEEKAVDLDQVAAELDEAFKNASGEIYKTLKDANSHAFEVATLARAKGRRFSSQLEAYRASKEIYKHQLKLGVLEEALGDIKKYLVVADQNDTQIFIIDVAEQRIPSLYDLGMKESGKK